MAKKVWYAPNGFEAYGEKEIKAVEECLRDGWLAGFGKRSIEFEQKIADIFGKNYHRINLSQRSGEYPFTLADSTFVKATLGWKPTKKLVDYIKSVK